MRPVSAWTRSAEKQRASVLQCFRLDRTMIPPPHTHTPPPPPPPPKKKRRKQSQYIHFYRNSLPLKFTSGKPPCKTCLLTRRQMRRPPTSIALRSILRGDLLTNKNSCHAAVKKLVFDRFRMGRTSIVFRSKAVVWGVSLLCFQPIMRGLLEGAWPSNKSVGSRVRATPAPLLTFGSPGYQGVGFHGGEAGDLPNATPSKPQPLPTLPSPTGDRLTRLSGCRLSRW